MLQITTAPFYDDIARAPKGGTVEFRTQVAGVLAKRAAVIAYNRATGAS